MIISSEEIRQYLYCPRILFYRKVLRVKVKETIKMRRGKRKHEMVRVDGLKNVYLSDPEIGLVAVIDALRIFGDEAEVIEIKTGSLREREMSEHHKMQLIAQAYLVEKVMGKKVTRIVVLNPETGKYQVLRPKKFHYEKLLKILSEIKNMLQNEIMPEPTPERGKCQDCEYRRLCEDVSIPRLRSLKQIKLTEKRRRRIYADLREMLFSK